ncbi:hypothetical protein NPIL_198451 [Nephila pilipes]|uniref:Uncharacterized protein n=1 Tax=Nephila pilipes TaxID=299642 RepID=A0A8X6U754_NEPPI|nr:hypothetical protein NPIL_198451 [Nephila pilipes]
MISFFASPFMRNGGLFCLHRLLDYTLGNKQNGVKGATHTLRPILPLHPKRRAPKVSILSRCREILYSLSVYHWDVDFAPSGHGVALHQKNDDAKTDSDGVVVRVTTRGVFFRSDGHRETTGQKSGRTIHQPQFQHSSRSQLAPEARTCSALSASHSTTRLQASVYPPQHH